MNTQDALLDYTLRLADDALILGHRLSEWCGHGPVLEQDIAITNISLDHLGRARSLYQYAADQFNKLPEVDKKKKFASVSLQNIVDGEMLIDEDDLAYLRDGWDFRNALLLEQPNGDWAYTTTRSFFYDLYNFLFYTGLKNCKDETLSAIAEKSLKEIAYHLKWSTEWMIRLGDGTEESHTRLQNAIDDLWMYTGELMTTTQTDKILFEKGLGVDLEKIKTLWTERMNDTLNEATINIPANTWMQQGGRTGTHSEYLGHILAELQFLQRAYPGMEW